MRIVDANIILRYLLEDLPEQAEEATAIIDNHRIYIPVEVLSEVVYVLEKVYKTTRKDIGAGLTDLLNSADVDLPYRDVVLTGLKYYSDKKLDFVDCLLAGYAKNERAEIHTFDADLRKLIDKEKTHG